MNCLVTGATGFIGPYLVKKLVSSGHECRCLVRLSSKNEQLKGLGAELLRGDITDAKTLNGIADGIDCIFHMATLGHMSNFRVTETMFREVNVLGTLNIMREALKARVRKIVHCSSVAAMGICSEVPATEESECHPHHPYGRSKLEAENEVLRMVIEDVLPAVIVRFSMVYGPGDRRDILRLAKMAKRGLVPKIGNGPKMTPLIHVEDAVDGLILAAEKGGIGEIYILTNPQSEPFDHIMGIITYTLDKQGIPIYVPEWFALGASSFLEKLFNLVGKAPPLTRKNIESTLADRVFSIEKAKKELGFRPIIDPVEGLKKTVEWYQQHGWI